MNYNLGILENGQRMCSNQRIIENGQENGLQSKDPRDRPGKWKKQSERVNKKCLYSQVIVENG